MLASVFSGTSSIIKWLISLMPYSLLLVLLILEILVSLSRADFFSIGFWREDTYRLTYLECVDFFV